MWRTVGDDLLLSELTRLDREALVEHLADKEIHDWTVSIPHPYTLQSADDFIGRCATKAAGAPTAVTWAIRTKHDNGLIGCIGLEPGGRLGPHRADMGYWLAREHRGKGIMTRVVNKVCEVGLGEMELVRISATVFEGNERSTRLLERCGFAIEGRLKHYLLKDGRVCDGLLYARTVSLG